MQLLLVSSALVPVVAAAEPDGEALYQRHCSVCHGEQGAGALWGRAGLNPPPLDFTATGLGSWLSRERMVVAVSHGRPGTAMVAFGQRLDPAEIHAVVDHIRERFMAPAVLPARTPEGEARVGDAAQGAAIYAANCATCHGYGGRGDGPRAYFIFPRPRDFTSATSREHLDRLRLNEAIRHGVRGREMPGWGTVLDDQEIANVAEYVYRVLVTP